MQVIGAAFNPDAPTLLNQFLQQFRPTFPIGMAERLSVMEYMQQSLMTPGYVPFVMFIDRKLMVRAQHTGDEPFLQEQAQAKNIRDMLDSLLKEGNGPPAKKSPATGKKTAPKSK